MTGNWPGLINILINIKEGWEIVSSRHEVGKEEEVLMRNKILTTMQYQPWKLKFLFWFSLCLCDFSFCLSERPHTFKSYILLFSWWGGVSYQTMPTAYSILCSRITPGATWDAGNQTWVSSMQGKHPFYSTNSLAPYNPNFKVKEALRNYLDTF